MSLFTVDKAKCRKDGFCAAECPVQIIRIEASSKLPVLIEGGEERCINCGHCVAVCPHQAFRLSSMALEDCPELPQGWELAPEQVSQLLKARRSIRVYKEDPVSEEIFLKVLDAARYAPSGMNRQPLRWLIIREPQKVQELARLTIDWMRALIKDNSPLAQSLRAENLVLAWDKGQDLICRRAPHLVVPYGLKEDFTALGAATIALTYLELAALPFELGTCWAGYANMALNKYPLAREFTGISKRCDFLGAMMIGYPKLKYYRFPLRNVPQIKWI
ncbi:MAG: nitroreductase family protein [Candidatus Omnitrophica bacterium]|nr:nitroreductase family protein [Candidatus Omnitrophota bacterium]